MPGESFVISDLHLGHANIIKYCARPFLADNVQEMDRVLIQNWNASVRPEDTVYYLGDLRYGRDAGDARSYLQSLSGKINLIRGNHDCDLPDARETLEIEYGGISFLLIHDPCAAPPGTKRWVVHGHMHNNDLKEYPFINFKEKRINVSAEVIGYRPVSLRRIAGLIRENDAAGRQKNILILRPSSRYSQNDDQSFSDC
jgi:calcineurin-like phosphoesterase family protein